MGYLRLTFLTPLLDKKPLSPYLEEVISWWDVGDVDPLAVDVVSVHIPAANSDPLFTKIGTLVLFLHI